MMEFNELVERARSVVNARSLSNCVEAGEVGAAILSASGKVYVGVCIDASSGMGFCAEHSAAAAMVTAGESVIRKVVAVNEFGEILPPCGRCREFMSELDDENCETEVLVKPGVIVKLKELLPYDWREVYKRK